MKQAKMNPKMMGLALSVIFAFCGCASTYEGFVGEVSSSSERKDDEATVRALESILSHLQGTEQYGVHKCTPDTGWGSRIKVIGCIHLTDNADLFSDPRDPLVVDTSRHGVKWSPQEGTIGVVWLSGKGFMVDRATKIITMMGFK